MHNYQVFSEIEKKVNEFNYTTEKLYLIAIKIEFIEKKVEETEFRTSVL